MAPAPALAHGVPAPTASTLEAVPTPHSFRTGSSATMEKVFRRGAEFTCRALSASDGVPSDEALIPVMQNAKNKRIISAPTSNGQFANAQVSPQFFLHLSTTTSQ